MFQQSKLRIHQLFRSCHRFIILYNRSLSFPGDQIGLNDGLQKNGTSLLLVLWNNMLIERQANFYI